MNKLVLFFLVLMISSSAYSFNGITKKINLFAHIDNEGFYSYSVNEFRFKDPVLEILYSYSKKQFISKSTKLIIKTDIPVNLNAGYEITASSLESSCVDNSGLVVEKDFATYYLEGNLLTIDKPIVFDSFSDSGSSFLSDTKTFSIEFLPTPDLNIYKSRCEGSASLYIGLRL